ncbi:MAG: hypothetical protein Q4C13_08670 [Clostridia bacterium]|nr:hypothetical protein [Clostridia bacterium]
MPDPTSHPEAMYAFINASLDKLADWRSEQLNLDGGCGLIGRKAGALHRDWLYSFSSDAYLNERIHPGTIHYDDIEAVCIDLFKEVYRADYVDLNAMSAGTANMALLCALTKRGDSVMAFADPLGHNSLRSDGLAGFMDLRVEDIPYDPATLELDLERFRETALRVRPSLILLGSALYLFMEPFNEIRRIADEVGAYVSCDVSHTFGIIPSGALPNPLDEGVDVLVGGTYKTFCAPCKGIILTNRREIYDRVHKTMPRLIYSNNANYVPALTQALMELKAYGEAYGAALIKNARALAGEMEKVGFDMCFKERGYTQTHLIAARMNGTDRQGMIDLLTSANILCSTVPCDAEHFYLRPATLVTARQGFTEADMPVFARLLHQAVHLGRTEETKAEVRALMRDHAETILFSLS